MNKNPKRNASGYVDYTAFYAIRAADREIAKKKRKPQMRNKGGKTKKNNKYFKETGGIIHEK
jgi:hypothetical protein